MSSLKWKIRRGGGRGSYMLFPPWWGYGYFLEPCKSDKQPYRVASRNHEVLKMVISTVQYFGVFFENPVNNY